MFTFSGDVMLHLQSLSPADIKGIRQSWGLAKDAAPFEVHGPAFYRLYDRDIFYLYCIRKTLLFSKNVWESSSMETSLQSHGGPFTPGWPHGVTEVLVSVIIPEMMSISQYVRFVKHTATVFRFLDKCVEDLDNPTQTIEKFRRVTKIHAVQGLGVRDFVIIKGHWKDPPAIVKAI